MIHLGDDMSNDMRSYLEKKLLETRTILLYGQINQVQAYDITQKLLLLSAMSNDDIKLIINSQGGHVESGDTIFDMIRYVEPKVKIIGTGFVASAGALIYASVPVEQRYSLPNTRYMLHQPLGGARGQASDIEIEANEIIKMRKRLNQTFADATGHPLEKIEKDSDRNFWLSAEEAKDYNLVGHIVSSSKEL
ncbi:MAG: ATP-dependent Clp protease proteolytic subunit [Deltaproteobacteria bacterium]|nr:MAG: ATP-dependent Clp protease proteolytic subunit [Deltaproteobacteria bacterium]